MWEITGINDAVSQPVLCFLSEPENDLGVADSLVLGDAVTLWRGHTWDSALSVGVHSLSPLQAPAPGSWPLVRSSEGASLLGSAAFRPGFS